MLGTADYPACTNLLPRKSNFSGSVLLVHVFVVNRQLPYYSQLGTARSMKHARLSISPTLRSKRRLFQTLATTQIIFTGVRRLPRTIMGAARAPDPGVSAAAQSASTQPEEYKSSPKSSVQPDGVEEGRAAYRSGGFHPVYIGDVFNDRFKVLNKIGYGQYSTVWLVKDTQARSVVLSSA